jgi:Ser/Thr protein kinase RdoA (MazF antagonist)
MWRDDEPDFMQCFLSNFLAGYRRVNRLDPAWLSALPAFIRLREVDLYGAILHSFSPQEIQSEDWLSRYMTGRKERIIARKPFIDYDWLSLAKELEA